MHGHADRLARVQKPAFFAYQDARPTLTSMPRSRGIVWILPGLVAGLFLGAASTQRAKPERDGALAMMIDQKLAARETDPIRCGVEVDAEGWTVLRDTGLAIEMKYPPTYVMEKNAYSVTLRPADGSDRGIIRMEKTRSTLKKEIDPDWQLASWKMADRRTFALTTPFYTGENGRIWMKYLLVREFPFSNEDTLTMFRVTIDSPLSEEDYAKAKQAGLVDYETILTLPEQILSTFRFLGNGELPEEKLY